MSTSVLEDIANSSKFSIADSTQFTESLMSFGAPYLEEKMLKEEVFSSSEEYETAFAEFKKYVALVYLTKKPLPMVSKPVDLVWHQFILFTEEYASFCSEYLGHFLHHKPNTSFSPSGSVSAKEFFDAYKSIFGDLNKIWLYNCQSENLELTCSPPSQCASNCGPSTCGPK